MFLAGFFCGVFFSAFMVYSFARYQTKKRNKLVNQIFETYDRAAASYFADYQSREMNGELH